MKFHHFAFFPLLLQLAANAIIQAMLMMITSTLLNDDKDKSQ